MGDWAVLYQKHLFDTEIVGWAMVTGQYFTRDISLPRTSYDGLYVDWTVLYQKHQFDKDIVWWAMGDWTVLYQGHQLTKDIV